MFSLRIKVQTKPNHLQIRILKLSSIRIAEKSLLNVEMYIVFQKRC